eukprot:251308-Prorocentrum_minimum.AAC.5
MAERSGLREPSSCGTKRRPSSPPSPVLERPPILFMARARLVCASSEMDPYDMAPVQKRFTISLAGSTC